MRLTVLGAGGGWPRPGGAACGYLLRHDGYTLWLDAGTGTLANLQRHVELSEVQAVVVSHRHFDHFLDLYPFYLSRWWPRRTDMPSPVPLYAPPGMFDHALQLEGSLPEALRPEVVEPGSTFDVGPFRVETAQTAHPVPTLGARFEADGSTLAYSADTGPCEELIGLARNADVLLCEATWLDRPAGSAPIHMTATDAGTHAAKARVGRLVLTHIWPTIDRSDAAARAEAAFGGEVQVAEEGLEVEV